MPKRFARVFAGRREVLRTHAAYDIGALGIVRELGREFGVLPLVQPLTRLLIDSNRSPHHPKLFSEFSRGLGVADQEELRRAHRGHREEVFRAIDDAVASSGRAVHIAVHSFTPVLDGQERNCDIGLLYDPRRSPEGQLANAWRLALAEQAPELRVRRNYPYKGAADGLLSTPRAARSPQTYVGLELELNQTQLARFGEDGRLLGLQRASGLVRAIRRSLTSALAACAWRWA